MAVDFKKLLLDVRPDRLDLRDRLYQPPLVSLPDEYPSAAAIKHFLPKYKPLILDQGSEGACTGFGLACMINYLRWSREWRPALVLGASDLKTVKLKGIESVSPRMLYHLARFYDEWAGEDYEGSSCRGAMKGWHRHGVCLEPLWPYLKKFVPPKDPWRENAMETTVGAYYRVDPRSVSDMQSAIYETGAIYVSADVHEGWNLSTQKPFRQLPVIALSPDKTGGHAFAMIGFTREGFIIQNSWGTSWGYCGFAILTYADWVANGWDAWVAALGVPASKGVADRSAMTWQGSGLAARQQDANRAGLFGFDLFGRSKFKYGNDRVRPWDSEQAYQHMLVLGNNGAPISRIVHVEDAWKAVELVCGTRVRAALKAGKTKKLMIYAHGGLNSESDAVARTQVMAPYFQENGIYPLFIGWQTGLLESIGHIIKDAFSRLPGLSAAESSTAGGPADWFKRQADRLSEAKDRTIENVCEQLARPIWTQMKQNASLSRGPRQGAAELVRHMKAVKKDHPDLEIHLVGHSAGSILFGYLLDLLREEKLGVASCTLYAPACSVEFANQHYQPAITSGTLNPKQFHIDILSDDLERADNVIGLYGQSLLYLVSRALEDAHKTPLLGMYREWMGPEVEDELKPLFSPSGVKAILNWREFAKKHGLSAEVLETTPVATTITRESTPAAHGSFDNDIRIVAATIRRILGISADGKLPVEVENLTGF